MSTLYDELGGAVAIDAAVDIFYRKILSDDRVSEFFSDVDMDNQINKQRGFLTMVFGGPNNYTGKDMRSGHKHLVERGLVGTHVDIIIEHLSATLKDLGVADESIRKVAATANSVRSDILNQ
ncbi:Cyanoglobin; Hemoglobin-like protein HbN [hydrothermal vent metagenome]|uniref:Cyanoglobin Hemoglobin-like protein HbN n=1 Tax=hydrothermal vent metagenome TaxID=652676 RepID=A0A3B0YMX5_9ZZZZ